MDLKLTLGLGALILVFLGACAQTCDNRLDPSVDGGYVSGGSGKAPVAIGRVSVQIQTALKKDKKLYAEYNRRRRSKPKVVPEKAAVSKSRRSAEETNEGLDLIDSEGQSFSRDIRAVPFIKCPYKNFHLWKVGRCSLIWPKPIKFARCKKNTCPHNYYYACKPSHYVCYPWVLWACRCPGCKYFKFRVTKYCVPTRCTCKHC